MTASPAINAISARSGEVQRRERFPHRFFVVTFLWSWIIWLPLVLAGSHIGPLTPNFVAKANLPFLVLAAFGPAVGAVYSLSTLKGWQAVRNYLYSILDLRLGWRVWLLTPVLVGGITCAAWKLPELWGAKHLVIRAFFLSSPLNLLTIAFFAGSQEELGWRGYILDPLELRFGPWLGSLVLGVMWALWHLPLFFIPDGGLGNVPFPAFLLLTTGCSWLFSSLRAASGRRTLSGFYAHAMLNVFGSLFPTSPQVRYWLWATFALVIGLIATAIRADKSSQTVLSNTCC